MNTNLIHNILNVVIALTAALTAVLAAYGCVEVAGVLDCSQSTLDPKYTAIAAAVLAVVKTVINIVRDGFTGLAKKQPPVQ